MFTILYIQQHIYLVDKQIVKNVSDRNYSMGDQMKTEFLQICQQYVSKIYLTLYTYFIYYDAGRPHTQFVVAVVFSLFACHLIEMKGQRSSMKLILHLTKMANRYARHKTEYFRQLG